MHRKVLACALVAGVLLTTPGCSAQPKTKTATAPATTTESFTATDGPAATTASATPAVVVAPDAKRSTPATPKPTTETPRTTETGRQFGYVKGVRGRQSGAVGTRGAFLVVDYAQFLTGDAAAKAAKAAGDESPPPNDYYIVNSNPKVRSFRFAPTAKIGYMTSLGDTKLKYVRVDQYIALLERARADDAIKVNPYWVWLKDGQIVRMDQQYLP